MSTSSIPTRVRSAPSRRAQVTNGKPPCPLMGATSLLPRGQWTLTWLRSRLTSAGAPSRFLPVALVERWPTWSPDGGQVAYVTNLRGTPEIWIRSLGEGRASSIVDTASGELQGAWNLHRPVLSPDGERIVYEAWDPGHAVWTSLIAGGPAVRLDPVSSDHHSPSWSPDGNWVAYQRFIEDRWELVKKPLSGGEPVSLAEAPAGGGLQTAWSPTGEWIAHVLRRVFRLVAADGQQVRDLGGPPPAAFGFSKDGSQVYAVRQLPDGRWELATLSVESAEELSASPLDLPANAAVEGFSLHPDGQSFATSVGLARFDIWLLDDVRLPGTEPR